MTSRCRLAMVYSHPIHYYAPLLRKIAAEPSIDLTVLFCSTAGATREYCPDLGGYYQFDLPLLSGYRSVVVPNRSPRPTIFKFSGLFNPGLASELQRGRFDAVVVHGWGHLSMLIAIAKARLARIPVLVYGDSADTRPLGSQWLGKSVAKRLYLRTLLPAFNAYLVSGTFNRDFYRHFGASDDRMFLAPWSVDNDFFIEGSRTWRPGRDALLQEIGLDPAAPVFLWVGKMVKAKRAIDLLGAAERLVLNGRQVSVVLAGDGPERPALEAYVRDRGLSWVRFLGFVNQSGMPRTYALADVFVQPSEREARATVVNEAMASSLPVVVSDGTGVWGEGDIVRHGENGFVFRSHDVDDLARALEPLAADPSLRACMGQRSLEIIRTWSHDAFVDGLRRALAFVAPSHSRSC